MLRILVPLAVGAVFVVCVAVAFGGGEAPPPVRISPQAPKQTVAAQQYAKPLVLPNIPAEVRKLQGAQRVVAARQLVLSQNVIRFWSNHRWQLAPNHTKCNEVPWQRSCTVARASLRLHKTLSDVAARKLDATDPIIANLNRGLSGTPMEGLGRVLRDEGKRMNVSPYFIAAAAGTESSFGAAGCGGNPRNVWGLAACDGRWSVPYFGSWQQAIRYYAEFIHNRWPSATSPYHFYGYAACDSCWGNKTSMWMRSRFGVEAYTKYPG